MEITVTELFLLMFIANVSAQIICESLNRLVEMYANYKKEKKLKKL